MTRESRIGNAATTWSDPAVRATLNPRALVRAQHRTPEGAVQRSADFRSGGRRRAERPLPRSARTMPVLELSRGPMYRTWCSTQFARADWVSLGGIMGQLILSAVARACRQRRQLPS